MADKINIVGKEAERIHDTGRTAPRIDPEEFAASLGAEPCSKRYAGDLDPISLAELGNALLERLRSTGGRPSLADATKSCKVPLSAEDIEVLEQIAEAMERTTGMKPSMGQIGSVILRAHLHALKNVKQRGNNQNAEQEQNASTNAVSESAIKSEPATDDAQVAHLLDACKELIKKELQPIREDLNRLLKNTRVHA